MSCKPLPRNWNPLAALLAFPVGFSSLASAEAVLTNPLGFNKVTCLPNSDTIVGVPFRSNESLSAILAAPPSVVGDVATLTLAGNPALAVDAYANVWYVKFTSGTRDGAFHPVTANTANTLTLNLNGDNLDGVITGDTLILAKYWTLDTLFPPAEATTDPLTTGHAIVASTGTSLRSRRTQVLLPDIETKDINLAPKVICYISDGVWLASDDTANPGSILLEPDVYLVIRHPASVTSSTVFRSTGEVDMGNMSIPLPTRVDAAVDCHIAIPRPVDLELSQLNLIESGAFVPSSGTALRSRKDQLFVYNNQQALLNKAPAALYFHDGTQWLNASTGNSPANSDLLAAGAGFVIRKARTLDGATAFWSNPASYTP